MKLPATFISGLHRRAEELVEGIAEGEVSAMYEPISKLVDSPIEEMLALAVLTHWRLMGEDILIHRGRIFEKGYDDPRSAALTTQMPISGYRVDFLLCSRSYPRDVRFVIECDGHDFHERTKEQAARDRARDRTLTALGYTVLRFTGSEIHRDAFACAADIYSHYDGRICDVHVIKRRLGEDQA